MRTIQELIEKVEELDSEVGIVGKYKYKQFTIDQIEEYMEYLISNDASDLTLFNDMESTIVGAFHYKLDTLLEVIDPTLLDYKVFKDLLTFMDAK